MPYSQKAMNSLDRLSTVICGVSIILAILAYQNPLNYLQVLSFILIIIINIYFVIVIILKLLESYTIKFEDKIDKVVFGVYKNHKWIKDFIRVRTISKERVKELWQDVRNHFKIFIQRKKTSKKATFVNDGFKISKIKIGKDQQSPQPTQEQQQQQPPSSSDKDTLALNIDQKTPTNV